MLQMITQCCVLLVSTYNKLMHNTQHAYTDILYQSSITAVKVLVSVSVLGTGIGARQKYPYQKYR